MGWVQKVGNNYYRYEYRDGKNTYIGKCTEDGTITEPAPGFEDEMGPPPSIEEQTFYNMLMEKLTTMTEKERVEMLDIEHGDDYESVVAKQGEEYLLLMRPKEDIDYELLQNSILQREAMHDLEELEVDEKSFIVLSSAHGDPEDEAEIVEGLKTEGREQGKNFHLVRMNHYLWGEESE